jgi:hypothetical protein
MEQKTNFSPNLFKPINTQLLANYPPAFPLPLLQLLHLLPDPIAFGRELGQIVRVGWHLLLSKLAAIVVATRLGEVGAE